MRARLIQSAESYRWLFAAGGALGGLMFLVGSTLFLSPATERWGVWLFICGSALMLANSIISFVVDYLPRSSKAPASQRTKKSQQVSSQTYGSGTKIAPSLRDRQRTA